MIGTMGITKGVRAVAGIALIMAAPTVLADILYEQAPEDGGGAFMTGEHFGHRLQYADSFEVTGPGWRVDSISWWGGFSDFNGTGGEAAPFDIRIYIDEDGAPSSTETVASFEAIQPDMMETDLTGDLSFGSVQHESLAIEVQQFTWRLTNPLTLGANRYHLSVDNPGSNVTFSWLMSTSGNDEAWFRTGNPSDWASQEYNLAYNLTGKVIPEPATLTLLGIGVAGLGLRRWRGRKRTCE